MISKNSKDFFSRTQWDGRFCNSEKIRKRWIQKNNYYFKKKLNLLDQIKVEKFLKKLNLK